MTSQSWLVAALFFAAALAWLTEPVHGVAAAVVALALAGVLFATRLLHTADLAKLEWETLMLIAGGLTLGELFDKSGLAQAMASVAHWSALPPLVLLLAFVFACALRSAIASNTAAAAEGARPDAARYTPRVPDRPIVLVSEGSDAEPLEWLRERARVLEIPFNDPSFDSHLSDVDGLVIRTYTRVNDALLARSPRLKVVGRGGVGLENIDLEACRRRGVRVVHTPNANTNAVGDYVFGVLLRLVRDWVFLGRDNLPDMKEFKRVRDRIRGRQLDELTLGILGMGRVGRRVGRIASAGFGMRVIYNDLLDVAPQLDFPATSVDKDTLYRNAGVLSIHVDMRPGNANLVGRDQLALMKRDAILINASRGEVLDAVALADALREQRLAVAALDVYHPEPPPPDFPLLGMPNVLLTPHLASRTWTATANMSWVVRDVIAVLEGLEPQWAAV